MPDDRVLALDLDRALAGEEAGNEARLLAALLVAAAKPSRVRVSEHEVDRALRHARRPARTPGRRLVPALALGAAAAVAVAAWLVRAPGSDVQARAAGALEGTFFVVQETRSDLFPATDVSGYVDGANGRAHLRVTRRAGGLVSEIVLRADGRVERWLAATNTTTLAPTCAALPGGCAEALDPLDLYLRTVERARVRRDGGTYALTIREGRVEQVVTIDARTYLPRRIEWRQGGRVISVTRFAALEHQRSAVGASAWRLSDHPGARVVQVVASGARVRILSVAPSSLPRGSRWLGAAYEGHAARIDRVRLTGGEAVRIAYGPLVVWNYETIVPPPVLQLRGMPAKVFAIPGGVVHASFAKDGVVADASFADGNVAVVSTAGDKVDVIRAVQRLMRPGSP